MAIFGWICVAFMVAGVPLILGLHYRRRLEKKAGFGTWFVVGLWLFAVFDFIGFYAQVRWKDLMITMWVVIATIITLVVGGTILWILGDFLSPLVAAEVRRCARRKAWQDRHWTSKSK